MKVIKELFRRHIIQDMPDELARCEFDCRVNECSHGNWMTCKKRILFAKQLRDPATFGAPGSPQPKETQIKNRRRKQLKKNKLVRARRPKKRPRALIAKMK